MPAVGLKAPFWLSPWSKGVDHGRGYQARTIAPSRADRKKKRAEIRIYDDVVAPMTPKQREDYVAGTMREAIRKLGLLPTVVAEAKLAMLHGWDPKAKAPSRIVAATR